MSSTAVAEPETSTLSLKCLRERAGLSQRELASASGVSIETIKRIESGKAGRPHPYTMRQLASVLGQQPVVTQTGKDGPAFAPDVYNNAGQQGTPVMQILVPGNTPMTQPILPAFVPLRQTVLRGNIVGPVADFRLSQVFRFDRSVCAETIEAAYRFPLPGDAAVTGVKVKFGEVEIETALEPRAKAEQEYEEAKQAGYQAALTTQEGSSTFTLKLTGIKPDEDVVVETHYFQLASSYQNGWQARVPLVSAPRYVRADEEGTPAANANPLQVWRDPMHRFSMDVSVEAAGSVTSPTHTLATSRSEDGPVSVKLIGEDVIPDRDLVLRWAALEEKTLPTLQVLTHEESSESARYIMALVNPPADVTETDIVAREIVLLIDRSASMGGPKWDAASWTVGRFLDGLRPIDSFNVGLFDNSCLWLSQAGPMSATKEAVEAARALVARNGPRGGTETEKSLAAALAQARAVNVSSRQVLLVTDGQVTDEKRILDLVQAEADRADRRRVNVICVDTAPNSYLATQIADIGGGACAFLTSSANEGDITSALDEIVRSWSQPVLSNVQLVIEATASERENRGAAATTRTVVDLGDIIVGRSQWVSALASVYTEPVIRLEADGKVIASVSLPATETAVNQPGVRALFGARQIGRLERLAHVRSADDRNAWLDRLGYADDPMRTAESGAESIDKILVRESLRYGIMSSATAFIGVRKEAGHIVKTTIEVPSALPAGWLDAPVAGGPSHLSASQGTSGTFFVASAASPRLRSAFSPRTSFGTTSSSQGWVGTGGASGQSVGGWNETLLTGLDNSSTDNLSYATKSLLPRTPRARGEMNGAPLNYTGTPMVIGDEAVLVDSFTGPFHLSNLRVGIAPAYIEALALMRLLIYVGDMSSPKIEVSLRDVLRGKLSGSRPANIVRAENARVRIVLSTAGTVWPVGHTLSITLA